jgi:glycosyltransferase involved in cell wall biosynthesis
MTRVLVLCSAVDPTGSVKQFDLALPQLREGFEVARHTLPADVRSLVAGKPNLIHTVGAEAFRLVRKLGIEAVRPGATRLPPWLASGAARVEPLLGFAPGLTATVSQSEYERDWAARLLPAPMQFSAKPAVVAPPSGGRQPPEVLLRRLTPPARVILGAGGFDAVANLKHAVWAFDVLKYPHPDLQLVLLSDGPQRADIERFAHSLGFDDLRVRCVGHVADVSPYLAAAEQVWGTHTRGGVKFLLEAMAAGVPVIASETPDARSVISPGANGLLVPIDRPVEFAKAAHGLLRNPDQRRALVVAGQATAMRYSVPDLAEALAGAYDTLTSSVPPRHE